MSHPRRWSPSTDAAIPHGTVSGYEHWGCRSDCCRTVRTAYRRQLRELYPGVDDIAVERACHGDRTIPLNGAELAAAFAWLNAHGYSLREIARRLGVADRTVSRWRSGQHSPCHARPGRKVA